MSRRQPGNNNSGIPKGAKGARDQRALAWLQHEHYKGNALWHLTPNSPGKVTSNSSAGTEIDPGVPADFSNKSYLVRVGSWLVTSTDETIAPIWPYLHTNPRYRLTTDSIAKATMQRFGKTETYNKFRELEGMPAIFFAADEVRTHDRTSDGSTHVTLHPAKILWHS